MAERSANQSELFDEDKIPTASPDQSSQRTIDDSGWWRANFLVIASVFVGVVVGLVLLGLIRVSPFESSLFRASAQFLGTLLWGLVLIFIGSSWAALYGYYKEAKILKQSNGDWQPSWQLYILATPFVTSIIVSLIYLYNRERYVGIPWEQLLIWR